ncbi:LANO_0H24938g1_1 [Lachancea nothofagi CBS 11611]|uniref:LANO_0H24938g1_1 n=1 Tax=Lachancea nothofagi CBS 11611 TaxID=1266666 RepID=A0A1G4KP20_9SACH|nr:LANO_0H24938g1_1 [Lachancea nothofagi CBS 11611]
MDKERSDLWRKPHHYDNRSFSVDDAINRGGLATDEKSEPINDPVALGLQLAGVGLVTKPKRPHTGPYVSKARNFSTNDIKRADTQKLKSVKEAFNAVEKFDSNVQPSDVAVENSFRELMESRAFFWGSARSGLENLSYKRKWQLVCKERLMRGGDLQGQKIKSAATRESDEALFDALKSRLSSNENIANNLYQVEKLLRRSDICQWFLQLGGSTQLAEASDLLQPDDTYVYLRCFKTLMNHENGRLAIVANPKIIEYLCSTLIEENRHLRVNLLSTELLLLLTYVENRGGRDTVVQHLDSRYSQWFDTIESILENNNKEEVRTRVLSTFKPQQLLMDYCLTSMFLINSILQVTSSVKEKLWFIKTLQESKVHRLFHLMAKLEYQDLDDEIEKYRSTEESVIEETSPELPQFVDISYGQHLNAVVQRTHHNPLEHPMHQIFEFLSQTLTTRTMSDSLKVLTLFRSILSYLKDYTYGEENINIESIISLSLNQLVDNLQSDEIAQRALDELANSQRTLEDLELEVELLRKDRSKTKGTVLLELQETKRQLADKEAIIESLQKDLDISNQQRKHYKKEFDRAVTHKTDALPLRATTISAFDHLKSRPNKEGARKLTRNSSLSKSSRFTSLSNFVNPREEERLVPKLASGKPFIGLPNHTPFNNSDDEGHTEGKRHISDLHLSSICDHSNATGARSNLPLENTASVVYGVERSTGKDTCRTGVLTDDLKIVDGIQSSKTAPEVVAQASGPVPSSISHLSSDDGKCYPPGVPSSSIPPPPPPPLPSNLQVFGQNVSPSHIIPPPPPPPPSFLISEAQTHLQSLPLRPEASIAGLGKPPPAPTLPDFLSGNDSSVKSWNLRNSQVQSGSGPLPPYPPPPPPFSFSIPTKTVSSLRPPNSSSEQVRMKQIHWEKIEDVADTIWNQETERQDVAQHLKKTGILEEISELFQIKQANNLKIKSGNVGDKGKVSILPRDLAQQFGINLHMFSSLSVDDFVIKVLHCDRDVVRNQSVLEFFAREDLGNIPQSLASKFAPYSTSPPSEEKPAADSSKLERADRIFLELCYNLKGYWSARSACLLTLAVYEKDYFDIMYKLQRIDDAVNTVRTSARLKDALIVIVEIGNYMNRKRASGIKLSSLQKLSFVKSSADRHMSFLHVVERFLRLKCKTTYAFIGDLSKVVDLGNLVVGQVEQDCQEYIKRITAVKQSLELGRLSNDKLFHPEDRLLVKMGSKIAAATRKANLLRNQCALTMRALENLMKLYGEDARNADSKNEFFHHFIQFVLQFKKAAKENQEKEDVERIYKQRKDFLRNKSTGPSSRSSDSASEDEADTVDVLIKRLRDVNKLEKPSLKRKTDDQLLTRTQHMLNSIQKI